MKFFIPTKELKKKINILSNALSTNCIVPSLENYLVEFMDGKLNIISSDFQTYIKVSIADIVCENITIKKICIPAKILNDLIKSLNDDEVEFNINPENFVLQLKAKSGVYQLICESASDFPILKTEINSSHSSFFFNSKKLKNIFSSLIVTTSNKSELTPSITGVFFETRSNEIKFTTTDGHRVSMFKIKKSENSENSFSIILPKKGVSIISNILSSYDSSVQIETNNFETKMTIEDVEINIKSMREKNFPDCSSIIPKNSETNKIIIIPKKDFLTSLKRISIFANKSTHYTQMIAENNSLVIKAKDMDFNIEGEEVVTCNYDNKEKITLGFDVISLAELIETIDADEIEINIKDNNSPCLLQAATSSKSEDKIHLALIMQMIG